MARFTRLNVYQTMIDTGLVPVFYTPEIDVAENVASACVNGGAMLLEFTNRGDHAIDVFSELEKYCRKNHPQLILGVGSVVDPVTAGLYISHGANFVVGPLLNPDVAKLCNRRKIAYCPGCGSVSEISQAEELGCEIVKVFPGAQVGGPEFVKAVKGPCPWTSIMPTGGVENTEASLQAWFKAGVTCVGMGSNLLKKDLIEAQRFDELAKVIRNTITMIKTIRGTQK